MSECLDMYGNEIEVGDTVKLYSLIGKDNLNKEINKVVGVGKVWRISGIASHKEPLLWVTGVGSCHHPEASRIKFKTRLTRDAVLVGLEKQQEELEKLEKENGQLKYVLTQKRTGTENISDCKHNKNSSYNGVGSWCNDCGGKWHISELVEMLDKENAR